MTNPCAISSKREPGWSHSSVALINIIHKIHRLWHFGKFQLREAAMPLVRTRDNALKKHVCGDEHRINYTAYRCNSWTTHAGSIIPEQIWYWNSSLLHDPLIFRLWEDGLIWTTHKLKTCGILLRHGKLASKTYDLLVFKFCPLL